MRGPRYLRDAGRDVESDGMIQPRIDPGDCLLTLLRSHQQANTTLSALRLFLDVASLTRDRYASAQRPILYANGSWTTPRSCSAAKPPLIPEPAAAGPRGDTAAGARGGYASAQLAAMPMSTSSGTLS
jgi:hypothetical protein